MKNTPIRKFFASVIAFFLVICTAYAITYAIYTSKVYQRAVIRNRDTEFVRFSSDKLYRVKSDSSNPRVYYYPVSTGQKSMSFSVCNYDQGKNTVVNQHKINYTIRFTFDYVTLGFDYKVNGKSVANGNTFEITGELAGNRRSSESYEIEFSENDYKNLHVTVEVIPTEYEFTKNNKLYATLIPIEYATTQGVSFEWEFTDDNTYEFYEVDAYNISMAVSGGEDVITVSWDRSKLDIDPYFKEMIINTGGIYTESENTSILKFTMNSEDDTSNYHVQFYQSEKKPSGWGWGDLPIEITSEKSKKNSMN